MANTSSEGSLRDDFEIYKTQVAICGWCALAVLVILIFALIYAIFAVRKLRKEVEVKIRNLEATRRFTISRPKVYSSTDPTSKLQGEIGKALSVDSRDLKERSPRSPSSLPADNGPSLGYLNHGYTNLGSPGLTSLYSNLNSPGNYPNINLRSPSANSSDKSANRVENFLNKTRQLYSQSSNDVSPRLPRTPTGNSNRDSGVFKFS